MKEELNLKEGLTQPGVHMPIWLHCNELRALCPTTNALCRTAEIGALLLKCALIVYIWPEKGVYGRMSICLPYV